MTNTNDMRREFEVWFTLFYNCPPIRDGNAYEGEALGRWISWQAATERAIPKWLPIEAAPKKMEDIDMWCRLGRIADCSWNQTTYGKKIGFVYESDYDCNGPVYELVPEPTHWMPLPTPPVIRQATTIGETL